jgi:hypothetical protein
MSNLTKFTKGNWYINDCGVHWNNPDLKRLEVCYSEIGEVICDTVYTEADANLIAAAPEMYELLEEIVDDMQRGSFCGNSNFAGIIRDLLAKARGES